MYIEGASSAGYKEESKVANEIHRSSIVLGKKPGEGVGRFSRQKWWLKQLIPHMNWAIYSSPTRRRHLVIWKSWLGKQTVIIDTKLSH